MYVKPTMDVGLYGWIELEDWMTFYDYIMNWDFIMLCIIQTILILVIAIIVTINGGKWDEYIWPLLLDDGLWYHI